MRAGARGSRKEPLARAELRRRGMQTRAGWTRGSGPARVGWGWGRRGRRSARIPPPAGVTPSIRPLCPRRRWDSVGCPVPWAALCRGLPRCHGLLWCHELCWCLAPHQHLLPQPGCWLPSVSLTSTSALFFLQLHLEPAAGGHEAKPAACPAGAGGGFVAPPRRGGTRLFGCSPARGRASAVSGS